MPQKTNYIKVKDYPGVYTLETSNKTRTGQVKPDLSYYVRYQEKGRRKMVFVGRRSDKPVAMTPAQASQIRAKLIAGVPVALPQPRAGKKAGTESAEEETDAGGLQVQTRPPEHWTFERLWRYYVKLKGGAGGWSNYKTDRSYFFKHLHPLIGQLHPADITVDLVGQIRVKISKKTSVPPGLLTALAKAKAAKAQALKIAQQDGPAAQVARQLRRAANLADRIAALEEQIKAKTRPLAPATVEKTIELMRRLANFGQEHDLCPGPRKKIKVQFVDNEKTEDLSPDQIAALMRACDQDPNQEAADMIRIALSTGLRRGSILKLTWQNINFQKGLITVKAVEPGARHSKSGRQLKFPIVGLVKQVLETRAALADRTASAYVFPGKRGGLRTDESKAVKRIVAAAGLPAGFRPLHGLRHTFASTLANTGQVDLYMIGKLLGHSPKSTGLTQRYAHLRDDALKKAAGLMDDIITGSRQDDQAAQEPAQAQNAAGRVIPFPEK